MRIFIIIALLLSFVGHGQDTLPSLGMRIPELPAKQLVAVDFQIGQVDELNFATEVGKTNTFGLRDHSFLKPYVIMKKTTGSSFFNRQSLRPLLDGNAFLSTSNSQESSFGYRTGAGLRYDARWNDKWHVKLNAVQGVYAGDSLYRPKSYLNWRSGNTNLYTDIRSRVSFTPNAIFNFQAGVDHNFYGEGSRSLFLSDYGNPYPFGLIRTRFWRLEYSILYQFLREGGQQNWAGKFASSHHISMNATTWLNIGIFETVVFNPNDSLLHRGFDVEYLNPMVFYRPQEYSVGSSDNVLLGIDVTARVKQFTFYSQFILDEFYLAEIRAHSQWWANKFGGQIGAKGKFSTAQGLLYVRTEFNFARPYTYAHLNDKLNYGNQGLPLAHPYGANFAEILAEVNYVFQNWNFYGFLSYSLRGGDANGFNQGANIYEPYINRPYEYGHFIGQGQQSNSVLFRATVSRSLRKLFYSTAFAETNIRYNVQQNNVEALFVLGLRSNLWNDYRNY